MKKRIARVTVEDTSYRPRVWLKVFDSEGGGKVRNIPRAIAIRERNLLVEGLSDSGEYDEVTAEAIP